MSFSGLVFDAVWWITTPSTLSYPPEDRARFFQPSKYETFDSPASTSGKLCSQWAPTSRRPLHRHRSRAHPHLPHRGSHRDQVRWSWMSPSLSSVHTFQKPFSDTKPPMGTVTAGGEPSLISPVLVMSI